MDEVSGTASGRLTLRNCFGRGALEKISEGEFIYRDGDAGLRISVSGPEGSVVSVDTDWFSEAMHEKAGRPVLRLDVARAFGAGPQRFVTVLRPFKSDK